MNINKGIATIAILGIILGVLVVGGGAYYVGTNKNVEKDKTGDVLNIKDEESVLFDQNTNKIKATKLNVEILNINEFVLADKYQYVNSPSWSPDGKWVAFSVSNQGGIYIKNVNNNTQKLLTKDSGSGFRYSWSSDSKAITYLSRNIINGKNINIIKIIEIDSGKTFELTTPGIGASIPVFNLKNEVIYSFKGTLIKRKWSNGTVGKEEIITENVPANIIIACPKGDKIVIEEDKGIKILDYNGRNMKTIVKNSNSSFAIGSKFSNDGNNILFSSNVGSNSHFFVYNIITEKVTDLGEGGDYQWISNDKIVFSILKDDGGHMTTGSDLYLINLDGTGKTQILSTNKHIKMELAISPDTKSIVYRDGNENGKIYIGDFVFRNE